MRAKGTANIVLMITVATLILVLGCSGTSGEPVSEITVEEATQVLDDAVAYAESVDIEGLCSISSSEIMCRRAWADAREWASVPAEMPAVMDTYIQPTIELADGSQATGGRVLVPSSTRGDGSQYRTDFLVFNAGSHGLKALNAIYWSGIGLGDIDGDGLAVTQPQT